MVWYGMVYGKYAKVCFALYLIGMVWFMVYGDYAKVCFAFSVGAERSASWKISGEKTRYACSRNVGATKTNATM